MNWITKLWKWICGLFKSKKLHKCVCKSSCCDRSSMLVVYDEKEDFYYIEKISAEDGGFI